jgi:ATP-dependent helicase HrpB
MLAFAFPDRVAKNRGNGSFVLANGRGASVEQTSALARASYIAVGELTGTAAAGRILLAAPISEDEIETQFADHIESSDEITFDRNALALRARRRKTLHAITLSEAPLALSPSAETARIFADGLIAAGLDRLPWSKAAKQWRDRVMFLRRAEGESWPDLSDDGLIAAAADWAVPALYDKTSLKEFSAGGTAHAVAVGIAGATGARGTYSFRGADRHHARDRLRGRAGADHRRTAAGAVWAQHPSLHRQR